MSLPSVGCQGQAGGMYAQVKLTVCERTGRVVREQIYFGSRKTKLRGYENLISSAYKAFISSDAG